jgi:hypothetical protein
MEEEQIMDNDQVKQNIVSQSFSAKFGTKGEVWRFLASEAKIYVPHYTQVTIWHLKDLASGKKR